MMDKAEIRVRFAKMVSADEVDEFARKLQRGDWQYVSFFMNRQKPAKRPDKEIHLKGFVPKNIREVVQDIIKIVETKDYLWIAFRGTKGRADCYVFTNQPYTEVFEQSGAKPAKRRVNDIAGEIAVKLREAGLRNLGMRHGKAGDQYSTDKHNARRIAIGRRDLNLNVFLVSMESRERSRPDTRWTNHRAFLLSKTTDDMIKKFVAWVKHGPSQVDVRNAARSDIEDGKDYAVATGAQ